jgi:hypothetical protein
MGKSILGFGLDGSATNKSCVLSQNQLAVGKLKIKKNVIEDC